MVNQSKNKQFKMLNQEKATIIFMDGHNVTKNHERYRLMGKDPVYRDMLDTVVEVLKRRRLCEHAPVRLLQIPDYARSPVIYAAMDECSVVFPNTKKFADAFGMGDCGDYVLAMFLEDFLKIFWQQYPLMRVKATIFQEERLRVKDYLAERIRLCEENALAWVCKDRLPVAEYMGKTPEEMAALLKEKGLYQTLEHHRDFAHGILVNL